VVFISGGYNKGVIVEDDGEGDDDGDGNDDDDDGDDNGGGQ
jgi:hypothetical protein